MSKHVPKLLFVSVFAVSGWLSAGVGPRVVKGDNATVWYDRQVAREAAEAFLGFMDELDFEVPVSFRLSGDAGAYTIRFENILVEQLTPEMREGLAQLGTQAGEVAFGHVPLVLEAADVSGRNVVRLSLTAAQ